LEWEIRFGGKTRNGRENGRGMEWKFVEMSDGISD
jgi:hypothetical protein